jgi:cullin 3
MNRKIKIKPFVSNSNSNLQNNNNNNNNGIGLSGNWSIIENAILQIYSKNGSLLSFEELYRNSYNLVVSKNGQILYENTKRILSNQLIKFKQSLDSIINVPDQLGLLKSVEKLWKEHVISMIMIRDILMYLVSILKRFSLNFIEFITF